MVNARGSLEFFILALPFAAVELAALLDPRNGFARPLAAQRFI